MCKEAQKSPLLTYVATEASPTPNSTITKESVKMALPATESHPNNAESEDSKELLMKIAEVQAQMDLTATAAIADSTQDLAA